MRGTSAMLFCLGVLVFSASAWSADPPGPKSNVACDKKANGDDAKDLEAKAEQACKDKPADQKEACKAAFKKAAM